MLNKTHSLKTLCVSCWTAYILDLRVGLWFLSFFSRNTPLKMATRYPVLEVQYLPRNIFILAFFFFLDVLNTESDKVQQCRKTLQADERKAYLNFIKLYCSQHWHLLRAVSHSSFTWIYFTFCNVYCKMLAVPLDSVFVASRRSTRTKYCYRFFFFRFCFLRGKNSKWWV